MPFLIKTFKRGLLPFLLIELLLLPSVAMATCNSAVTATSDHLVDNNDGTVSDSKTALVWQKCSLGQTYNSTTNVCDGSATALTWQAALQQESVEWRVPNIKELSSIVELSCYSPSINETVFPATIISTYWSSSPYADYSDLAWAVYFGAGSDDTYDKYSDYYVRLVRSGQ